jgi:GNAT superfamily N-acetyltransferase
MYTITTDKSRFDVDRIHRYLSEDSYWAKNIPRDIVALSIEHSLCFGAFAENAFAGFARVVTDYATFAYVADVFVLPEHRGGGVSSAIMKAIREHPSLQLVRRWHLVTRDAHGLYEKFGFRLLSKPERHMESVRESPYGA